MVKRLLVLEDGTVLKELVLELIPMSVGNWS